MVGKPFLLANGCHVTVAENDSSIVLDQFTRIFDDDNSSGNHSNGAFLKGRVANKYTFPLKRSWQMETVKQRIPVIDIQLSHHG
jgi:hypothetical protein